MSAPRLILVKHGSPEKVADQPPSTWPLSEKGRAGVEALAARLGELVRGQPMMFTSPEAKARQTAEVIAGRFAWPAAAVIDALAEHDRSAVGQMATPEFVAAMAQVFKEPGRRVLGAESAEVALDRFDRGLQMARQQSGEADVVIASHGTVIALWLAANARPLRGQVLLGYELWRRMPNPSAVVVEGETYEIMS